MRTHELRYVIVRGRYQCLCSFVILPQDWTELLIQNYRNFSIPCLPRARSTCTFRSNLHFLSIHVGLVRVACSFRCAISNSPSSLVMLVSGRDIVRDHLTAYARNACCKTFFPKKRT